MRLFVSIDVPAALTDAVADLQDEFADATGLRAVDPGQVHVTLKFLGEVPASDVDDVTEALRDAVETAGVSPFTARFKGVGAFPSTDYIRVVWLGVEAGTDEMTRLHEAIEAAMTDRGFDPEDRAFTPHVTIARMDHGGGKALVQQKLRTLDPEVGEMTVSEVRLTKSELDEDGPTYSTVAAIELPP